MATVREKVLRKVVFGWSLGVLMPEIRMDSRLDHPKCRV